MDRLKELFAIARTVPLSLHENNFDVYRHLAAPVFLDLLQTAVLSVLRAEKPELVCISRIRSVHIRYRYGVSVSTPAVEVVLVRDESHFSEGVSLKFKIMRGRLTYATGKIELTTAGTIGPYDALPKTSKLGAPVIYEWELPVRNNDRDPSRNINPGSILDGVFTSRWYFLKSLKGASIDDWIARGVGFFVAEAKINFFHPVNELGYLKYASWVTDVLEDQTGFTIPFEVKAANGPQVHSQGLLSFAVMDLSGERLRKQRLPDYVKDAFIGTP